MLFLQTRPGEEDLLCFLSADQVAKLLVAPLWSPLSLALDIVRYLSDGLSPEVVEQRVTSVEMLWRCWAGYQLYDDEEEEEVSDFDDSGWEDYSEFADWRDNLW